MPKKMFTPEQFLSKLRQISEMTALGRKPALNGLLSFYLPVFVKSGRYLP